MAAKYQKYSLADKEKLGKLCQKYKEEFDSRQQHEKYNNNKKRKFIQARTNATGFLSKAVREFYPFLRERSPLYDYFSLGTT